MILELKKKVNFDPKPITKYFLFITRKLIGTKDLYQKSNWIDLIYNFNQEK